MNRFPAVLASLAVLATAGCGSVDDRGDAASAAAVQMLGAVANNHGADACAILAPDTVSELEESAGKPCPEAILEEDLSPPGSVTGAAVYGQWAQVRLSDDTVFLGVFRAAGESAATDDIVASFSNRGNAGRHADLLAAGR